jgi:hypothetical protein
MSHRVGRIFTLSAVSAALAIGSLGAASANAGRDHPEDGPHHSGHHHCKGLSGQKKRNCEKHHHGGHEGANHT